MGAQSKIEWTDHTLNPWWGCVKVSPACAHCYAETFSKRTGNLVWGKDAPRRFFSDKHWVEPLKWNAQAAKDGVRKRVFCGSMCDVMEDRKELDIWRQKLYDVIEATPSLDWLLLTKRPQNFKRFLPAKWLETPLSNVWGMTTVEMNAYRWRIEALENTPFAVRGLSCEPLLESLTLPLLAGRIHWVICGGESGPGARPMHPDWARSLRDQCSVAGVPFFFKQWGNWVEFRQSKLVQLHPSTRTMEVEQSTIPTQCRRITLCNVGKKSAGALLDGIEWKQFPSSNQTNGTDRQP